jgi:hypothetical protein
MLTLNLREEGKALTGETILPGTCLLRAAEYSGQHDEMLAVPGLRQLEDGIGGAATSRESFERLTGN